MNYQKLPAMLLPPSLLQLWAELSGDIGHGDMDTQNRDRQVEFPPFPVPATRCGLRSGSLAAGRRAERGGHASSALATEAFAWLDSAASSAHISQAAIAMVTWKWCWFRPARALKHRKWHF